MNLVFKRGFGQDDQKCVGTWYQPSVGDTNWSLRRRRRVAGFPCEQIENVKQKAALFVFCLSLQEESSGYLAVFFLLSGVFSITTPSLFHFYNENKTKTKSSCTLKKLWLSDFPPFLLEQSHVQNSVAHHSPRGLGNLICLFCSPPIC